jgi:hypothetical protein
MDCRALQQLALQISANKTPEVFRRYNISDDADLLDAGARIG